jgi:hypothetical protein
MHLSTRITRCTTWSVSYWQSNLDAPLVLILIHRDHTVNRAHGTRISILNSCIPRVPGLIKSSCMLSKQLRKHGIKTQPEAIFVDEPRTHSVIHWVTVTYGETVVGQMICGGSPEWSVIAVSSSAALISWEEGRDAVKCNLNCKSVAISSVFRTTIKICFSTLLNIFFYSNAIDIRKRWWNMRTWRGWQMAIRILQRDFGTVDLLLEHCTIFQVAWLPKTHTSPKYHSEIQVFYCYNSVVKCCMSLVPFF